MEPGADPSRDLLSLAGDSARFMERGLGRAAEGNLQGWPGVMASALNSDWCARTEILVAGSGPLLRLILQERHRPKPPLPANCLQRPQADASGGPPPQRAALRQGSDDEIRSSGPFVPAGRSSPNDKAQSTGCEMNTTREGKSRMETPRFSSLALLEGDARGIRGRADGR